MEIFIQDGQRHCPPRPGIRTSRFLRASLAKCQSGFLSSVALEAKPHCFVLLLRLNKQQSFDGLHVCSRRLEVMITLTQVSKVFEGKRTVKALEDVSLQVDQGELVAIVGPSGSGKSTLLNLIGGLDRQTQGTIVIGGETLADLPDDDLTRVRRDKIGFIFQFFNLLPTLNCLENVALPLHLRHWSKPKIDERVKELLRMVHLEHRMDHLPDELSGGERQRVAIARALSVFPPILLADEPTGNLDTTTGTEILNLVHELHQRLNSTILIVTHDAGVAGQCQRILKLRDGHIVEDVRQ
jgi:putative ABC transport system ATP-binding protein